MKRIQLLLPNVDIAKSVVRDLLLAHIDWQHMHILANPEISLEGIPSADIARSSNLLAALARGTATGGLTGMLAGLVALTFPPVGLTIAGGALLAMTIGGAGFGAWTAGMIGVSIPNSQLEQFEPAIDHGQVLLLVDVPRARETEIESIIKSRYAAAEFQISIQNQPELIA